ncbi:MAG: hypothetical protein MAG453_00913 [Calditrichaeota bacterium]|nr:hypothetical protein [Calditrichota bacterium]
MLTEADWERILALNGGEPEALEASRPLLCADESTRDAIEGPPWLRDALEDPPWLRDAMHEQPRSRG